MNWYTIDKFPEKEGNLLVKIGDNYFVAYSLKSSYCLCSDNKIFFLFTEMEHYKTGGEKYKVRTSQYWIIPSNYQNISHWCYIEDPV